MRIKQYLFGLLISVSLVSNALSIVPPWTGGERSPRIEQSLFIRESALNIFDRPQNIADYNGLFQIGSSVYYLKSIPWYGYLPYAMFLIIFVIIVVKIRGILGKSKK